MQYCGLRIACPETGGVDYLCTYTVIPDVVVIPAGTFHDLVATQPFADIRVDFCHMNRAMDKLSPTKDSLLQHIRRVVYQAGIWTISTQTQLVAPSPPGPRYQNHGYQFG